MGEDFELVDQQQVNYKNTLSSQQQIQDLLLMTPHNWRTKAENKESLSTLEELTVTIDAQIHVFKAKAKIEVETIEEPIAESTEEVEVIDEEISKSADELETNETSEKKTKINPWLKN
jgi:23S rRNA (guanine745-N1)-methyltransferase